MKQEWLHCWGKLKVVDNISWTIVLSLPSPFLSLPGLCRNQLLGYVIDEMCCQYDYIGLIIVGKEYEHSVECCKTNIEQAIIVLFVLQLQRGVGSGFD